MSEQYKSDFIDEVSHARMGFLTWLGKRIMPEGHWAGDQGSNATKPRLYLTYDDGPHPDTTPQLIEILAAENISATFFVIGSHAEKHPQLVQQLAQAGHVIANHTYQHEFMPMLTTKRIESEIEKTQQAILQACGQTSALFRAPYGILDNRVADCLKERSMKPVYWSSVSDDWLPLGAKRVISRVVRKLSDGDLIVLHEGWFPEQTLDATRGVIKFAKRAGYVFEPLRPQGQST